MHDRHIVQAAIRGKDVEPPVVEDRAGIDSARLAIALAHVCRPVDRQTQRRALPSLGEHLKRIVDRLHEQVIASGQERGDHVHDLCQVGDLDHVCVADKTVEESGHDESVL